MLEATGACVIAIYSSSTVSGVSVVDTDQFSLERLKHVGPDHQRDASINLEG